MLSSKFNNQLGHLWSCWLISQFLLYTLSFCHVNSCVWATSDITEIFTHVRTCEYLWHVNKGESVSGFKEMTWIKERLECRSQNGEIKYKEWWHSLKVCVGVCVCSARELLMRMRETWVTDREASERCNYSSQQGEGEITTHSVIQTALPPCTCVCVYMCLGYMQAACVSVCVQATCVWERQIKTECVGGKKDKS